MLNLSRLIMERSYWWTLQPNIYPRQSTIVIQALREKDLSPGSVKLQVYKCLGYVYKKPICVLFMLAASL